MHTFNANYVVNEKGDPVSVLLKIEDYRKLLEELEELEDIQGYKEAKASGEKGTPFEEAIERIERQRR